MRVAIFAPYAYKQRYFETELEIAQQHLDAGDEVTLLTCGGALAECDMKEQRSYICVRCMGRSEYGLRLLDGNFHAEPFYCLTSAQERQLASFDTRVFDAKELAGLFVENFDIGWGALSSIVSMRRDPDVDLHANAALLDGLLRGAWTTYYSMRARLQRQKLDRVYAFNGRHAPMRAVLRACQAEQVECLLHERGHDYRHYELYKNALPHDQTYVLQQIEQAWQAASDRIDREQVGSKWFVDRTNGVEQVGLSFIAGQHQGKLPLDWDASRRNIGVFISSENEFVAIGDSWTNPLYDSQHDGLQQILQSVAEEPANLHLYVRVHPNLRSVDTNQTRGLARLKSPQLTIIPADDSVCTYSLMQNCDKVLTFGSTTGIEAVYWGRPSVLAGMSYYRDMQVTYNPTSHRELMDLLRADLTPHAQLPALKYGFYQATFGRPYAYYVPQTRYQGLFHGERVRPTARSMAKSRVVKLLSSATKRINRFRKPAA